MVDSASCSVEGCSSEAVRSLSVGRLSGTSLHLKPGSKKALLCKEHYKMFKKETKEQRKLERDRYRSWSKV
jgi:hypothetical protein